MSLNDFAQLLKAKLLLKTSGGSEINVADELAASSLYKGTVQAGLSLNGVSYADLKLTDSGYRKVEIQFDPLTTGPSRLYFKVNSTASLTPSSISDLAPEGYLEPGGVAEFWIDEASAVDQYLHVLITDSGGTPVTGGANDNVWVLAHVATPPST